MQTDASPSVDYPCLDAEAAAEAHDVHPFMTSRAGGKATRGEEGRIGGERVGEQRLRSELSPPLQAMACDVCLGLRHDLETPHAAPCGRTPG